MPEEEVDEQQMIQLRGRCEKIWISKKVTYELLQPTMC